MIALLRNDKFEELLLCPRHSRIFPFIEKPEENLDLPLHVRGTVFQKRVWNALRDVPLGKTTTYTEIAGKWALQRLFVLSVIHVLRVLSDVRALPSSSR